MKAHFGDQLTTLKSDLLVPIPMPWGRRFWRGTNPAAALAEAMGRELGIPCLTHLLKKPNAADPQLGLTRAGRFRNIRGQITLQAKRDLRNLHVLLVDDILTTGATCSEASRILKLHGVQEVTVLVVARTPDS